MKAAEERVMISRIEEPIYQATVIISSNVRLLAKAIAEKGGPTTKPILAKLDGRYYPVGNIETVMAAMEAGLKSIACSVIPVKSKTDMINLHLLHTRSSTYNPVRFTRMINEAISENVEIDIGNLPNSFRRRISLTPDVEKKLDDFVLDMGKKMIEVPSMLHIVAPLSRLDPEDQKAALKMVLNYTTMRKQAYPPDQITLNQIFEQYRYKDSDRNDDGGDDDGGTGAGGNTWDAGDAVEPVANPKSKPAQDRAGDDDVEMGLAKKKGSVGVRIKPKSDSIEYRCKCSRKIVVNLKNGIVQRMEENGTNILAVNDDENTSVCYMLPGELASQLELDVSDIINCYLIGGKKSEKAALITKRKIPKKVQAELSRALRSA